MRHITLEQYNQLLNITSGDKKLIIMIMWECGLGLSEILRLRRNSIFHNQEENAKYFLVVRNGKNCYIKVPREIIAGDDWFTGIWILMKDNKTPRTGRLFFYQRQSINHYLSELSLKLKMEKVSPDMIRSGGIIYKLKLSNMNIRAVAKALGYGLKNMVRYL
jgi:integrase